MVSARSFIPRLLTPSIRTALSDTPVVCLLGPRQSGKTTLVKQLAPGRAFISFEKREYYIAAAEDPDGFVEALPDAVTLDEVQRVPDLLHSIKLAVDRDRRPGRFLLTGSANLLLLPTVTESLAGRMEIVRLYPLTEAEKSHRPGRFLRELLDDNLRPSITARGESSGPPLEERLIRGGYPEPLTRTPARARQWYRQYLSSVIERDARDVLNLRDAEQLLRLLELISLRNAELLNVGNLAGDLGAHRESVENWLAVLERLFLVRRLPAWHSNASKRLIKSPKVHLIDSGLAATLANLGVSDWSSDRGRMGHLLETFVLQQLAAQATWTDPDLRFWHYRDKDKVEVDLVVTRGRKIWGIEIKASGGVTPRDGRGLRRLADRCGEDFARGVLFYAGNDVFNFRDRRILAVPLKELWER